MKVRVTASKPRTIDEKSIIELIDQEFEVNETYPNGSVSIKYGEIGGYFLYSDEFEVIEQ